MTCLLESAWALIISRHICFTVFNESMLAYGFSCNINFVLAQITQRLQQPLNLVRLFFEFYTFVLLNGDSYIRKWWISVYSLWYNLYWWIWTTYLIRRLLMFRNIIHIVHNRWSSLLYKRQSLVSSLSHRRCGSGVNLWIIKALLTFSKNTCLFRWFFKPNLLDLPYILRWTLSSFRPYTSGPLST